MPRQYNIRRRRQYLQRKRGGKCHHLPISINSSLRTVCKKTAVKLWLKFCGDPDIWILNVNPRQGKNHCMGIEVPLKDNKCHQKGQDQEWDCQTKDGHWGSPQIHQQTIYEILGHVTRMPTNQPDVRAFYLKEAGSKGQERSNWIDNWRKMPVPLGHRSPI